MKTYVRSNRNSLHFGDLFNNIDCVLFIDNAESFRIDTINGNNDIPYMEYPDDALYDIPLEDLKNITDFDVLDRLVTLDLDYADTNDNRYRNIRSYLTSEQNRLLSDKYYTHDCIVTDNDINKMLKKIKNCKDVQQLYQRKKNKTFQDKYRITLPDIKRIIKSLTAEECTEIRKSYTKRFLGNRLFVFKHKEEIWLTENISIGDVELYIKLDYDESDDSIVAYVSLHRYNIYSEEDEPDDWI